jgi:hypothetical protein
MRPNVTAANFISPIQFWRIAMKNFIVTLLSTSLLTLSALSHAGNDRDPHFTRDYACKVLESTNRQIESELRNNLDVGMPQFQVDGAGAFGVDYSTTRLETQASNSSPTSSVR